LTLKKSKKKKYDLNVTFSKKKALSKNVNKSRQTLKKSYYEPTLLKKVSLGCDFKKANNKNVKTFNNIKFVASVFFF